MSVPSRISFEVFPPKTETAESALADVCFALNQHQPKTISVTFGAGGGAQLKTKTVVQALVQKNIPTTPHISCVNMSEARLAQWLAEYRQLGIERLVVVQGDLPVCTDFQYAYDLVARIRDLSGDHFHITVAAYPEVHPRAKSPQADLDNLRRKIDAGANSAITQFFYNSDAYDRFLDSCDALNINIPIIPGIMPIHDYAKLNRFATACGAELPLWLRKQLEAYVHDPVALQQVGIEIVIKLCKRLLSVGAKDLHFYTLNQLDPTISILRELGYLSALTAASGECS